MSTYERKGDHYQKREVQRGSTDAKRCIEIGRRVLRALEDGGERAVVYGAPGKEVVTSVITKRIA